MGEKGVTFQKFSLSRKTLRLPDRDFPSRVINCQDESLGLRRLLLAICGQYAD